MRLLSFLAKVPIEFMMSTFFHASAVRPNVMWKPLYWSAGVLLRGSADIPRPVVGRVAGSLDWTRVKRRAASP
jgi:hypothetical protein